MKFYAARNKINGQTKLASAISQKTLLSALTLLSTCGAAFAGENGGQPITVDLCGESDQTIARKDCVQTVEKPIKNFDFAPRAVAEFETRAARTLRAAANEKTFDGAQFLSDAAEKARDFAAAAPEKCEVLTLESARLLAQPKNPAAQALPQDDDDDGATAQKEKFHWKPALIQSGIFLGVQHGFRMSQQRTRRELKGEFINDWGRTVRNLRGWRDGDYAFINYVAHPLQGGLTGRIFINNSDRSKKLEFNESKDYWFSRFKAMLWSTAWSTQFEIGPISEATIGNVGLNPNDRHKMAWVDLVVTPTVGTALIVQEDAIDKYVLKNWLERKNGNRTTAKIKLLRSLLTPTLSVSNLLRLQVPWKRDNR